MPKIANLALFAAAALGAAGAGLASGAERAVVEPEAPSFVRELGAARTATVGGTFAEVRRHGHFVLADAEGGTVTVDAPVFAGPKTAGPAPGVHAGSVARCWTEQ